MRKPPVEHARIELVGLAVDVDIAAREMRAHQRMAAFDHAGDQFVDEGDPSGGACAGRAARAGRKSRG